MQQHQRIMQKAVQRSTQRGKQQNSKHQMTVFMESPFEILERHDDHAHSDETSHEQQLTSKQTRNSGPLLEFALGDWLEDSIFQIAVATSLGCGRFSSSAYWKANGFYLAQENQEQEQQLARIQRAPPQQRRRSSPLALMLFGSEGCHHDANAH